MNDSQNTFSSLPDIPFESVFFNSADELRLHARVYAAGAAKQEHLPIVCLHGLARNAADFHTLASVLSHDSVAPRQIIVPDYRGRGRSQWATDWNTYTLAHELQDLLILLNQLNIKKALFIGTSRGGLLTMGLGAAHPEMIAGCILNDIGPVLEVEGLRRIKSYVGKLPTPRDEEQAIALVKQSFRAHFPAFTQDDWRAYAKGTWHVEAGPQKEEQWKLSYDPDLMKTLFRHRFGRASKAIVASF
jgi:pimeloyl-ACP methyl ester carboxylesterase